MAGTPYRANRFASIAASNAGDNELVPALAGKKIRVTSYAFTASDALTVRFESGTAGNFVSGAFSVAANGGLVVPYNPAGWFETNAGESLNAILSADGIDGHLSYVLVGQD